MPGPAWPCGHLPACIQMWSLRLQGDTMYHLASPSWQQQQQQRQQWHQRHQHPGGAWRGVAWRTVAWLTARRGARQGADENRYIRNCG